MSLHHYTPETCSSTKTYATPERAKKAAEDKFGAAETTVKLTYLIMQADNGRWVPVFVGERAMHAGVHFHFHVIA